MSESSGGSKPWVIVDARPVESVLVDLEPGATQGYRREQEGFDEVVTEIENNQASVGDRARVTEGDLKVLQEGKENMAQIKALLDPARKLVEVLEESLASIDNDRHETISTIAANVKKQAKKSTNKDLLALYEKTLRYNSAPANKGVKTRKKKAAEAAAAAAETEEETT